jgi:transglutaminase-like putative cysteine protease
MSWRIGVEHRTGYRYAAPVRASHNEARLTPPTVDGQRTVQTTLTTTPAVRHLRYVDYWGTTVHAFDVDVPHTELLVVARSVVDSGKPEASVPDISWADIAGAPVQDRLAELLVASPYVGVEVELVEIGASLRAGHDPVEAGRQAAQWTHAAMRYERGATHVHTSAAQARAAGRGVCQDFAHVTLALLRAAGLPARYVSGYLHPIADAEVGEATAGESHAWVEYWAGAWFAIDPTSLVDVGDRHVMLARGRDYGDVRPLSGVYVGGAAEQFGVTVEVTRLR